MSERQDFFERHADKFQIVPWSGCWIWTAAADRKGYGQVRIGGRAGGIVYAHRLSWEARHGPIPKGQDGLCVLHRCDVPSCINPDHLFIGTNANNVADRDAKGRGNAPCGEANGNARLTDAEVVEIRSLAGTATQQDIATRFGVTNQHIGHILSWKRRQTAGVK